MAAAANVTGMPEAAEVVNAAWSRGLCPPPALTIAEWAELNRIVAAPTPWPGPWRNHRTPYLRGIMEWLSPFSAARVIALMKASQLGGTEIGLNWVGFKIHHNPGSMMIVLPDMATTKEWSTLRLARLTDTTPCLRGKIRDARERDSGNTLFTKQFPGGFIKLTWASSAAKMRSTPAADLLLDEVDAFEGDAEGEGDPVGILKRRFTNFPRGKMFLISTPTGQNTSRIEREFQAGDQRHYFVPCPHCGRFQVLVIPSLSWEKGRPETARYICVGCREEIGPQHKGQMLVRGIWVATKGEDELRERGFDSELSVRHIQRRMETAREVSAHLNAMYSPVGCYSWADLAADHVKAAHNVPLLKVFTNTVRGETWKERGEAPDWQAIYGKREFYTIGVVPRGGLFLTLQVDVQGDRLEWELAAWGRGRERWSVMAGVISGDPSQQPVWDTLHELIRRDWPHADGATMPIWAAGIDCGYHGSGGTLHGTSRIYDFCGRFPQPIYDARGARIGAVRTVVPLRGGTAWDKSVEGYTSVDAAKKRAGLRIITVGTGYTKREVYSGIRLPMPTPKDCEEPVYPAGYWHYPDYQPDWFQGLCAESIVNGRWQKDQARNEPLDLGGYSVMLAELCRIQSFTEEKWAELERMVVPAEQSQANPEQPQPQPRRRMMARFSLI